MMRPLTAALAALIAVTSIAPAHAQEDAAAFAGLYSGSQAEVGAMLELGEDGRYRYQLAYGALDEWSAGAWTRENGALVLQGDPYVAPAFDISADPGPSGELSVTMVLPSGFDPQYFAITAHRKDGSASMQSMSSSGSLVLAMGDNPVVSVRPVLPVMDLLGPAFAVPEGGAAIRIAFKPNDLGFVGFSREVLRNNGEAFELPRHGIVLRFKRVR
jgi:hypothetical protein